MSSRIEHARVAPDAMKALYNLHGHNEQGSIDAPLRYLIELRVSQVNGCAYCVDLHSEQARKAGETQQRLDCLPVWREVPFFTARERAALAWAEAVTLVAETNVPDTVYDLAREHFGEKELVDLTIVIATMNAMNRMAISFRKAPAPREKM